MRGARGKNTGVEMGKVKSAIITALLVAAIVVLSLFAVISCDVPGSNGVKRYNSFISSIHRGGDLSGEAYTLLYPEGVISVSDYSLVAEDEANEDYQEYKDKYVPHGGVYVDKDKHTDTDALKESVAKDAGILLKRFGEKGYAGYSVSIEDDYVIRVSVPTNFTYAAYKFNKDANSYNDASGRSAALSDISSTVQILTYSGDMSLRDGTDYETSNSILSIKEDFASYFDNISYYLMGGTRAVKMDLSKEGFEKLNEVLTLSTETEKSAYIFIGENNTTLTLTMGKALENRTLLFTPDGATTAASNYAIVLNSVMNGGVLANSYNTDTAGSGTVIVAGTPAFGEYAAIYVLVALLLVLVAGIVASVVKYKKLGLVNVIMSVIYALVIVCALLLIEIQLTVGGAVTIVLGYALLTFTNFRVFEAVRGETLAGRTLQASVKTGYKKTLFSVLDLHAILVVVSAIIALVCKGELAACGLILFVAVLASYILYWFTRFMWFVISSPVKDKFKFCGFKREVLEDED